MLFSNNPIFDVMAMYVLRMKSQVLRVLGGVFDIPCASAYIIPKNYIYRGNLRDAAPALPCARGIPYILYIKSSGSNNT